MVSGNDNGPLDRSTSMSKEYMGSKNWIWYVIFIKNEVWSWEEIGSRKWIWEDLRGMYGC